MKHKFADFENFASSILPHEADFLMANNQLIDNDRLHILSLISSAVHKSSKISIDDRIDKRTYSHLKNWILRKLESIDVDNFLNWIKDIDQKIMQDSIGPAEERALLKFVHQYEHCNFYFTKFYEVLRNYSHFLLVRLRLKDYDIIVQFLAKYEFAYKYNKLVDDNLHKASNQIVSAYTTGSDLSKERRVWLTEMLYSDQVEGYLRYQALIRLHFCALSDKNYDNLLEHFDYIDQFFSKGHFYSRRILANYYFNRMLLHSTFKEYEKANHFGYLSLQVKTHDYLLYCNNLCRILIEQKKYHKGLDILKGASKSYKDSNNFYHKTDYVSYFMEGLIGLGESKSAEDFGMSFFKAYKKEIFETRWHFFLCTLIKCLFVQDKYIQIRKFIQSEKLIVKERNKVDNVQRENRIVQYYEQSGEFV